MAPKLEHTAYTVGWVSALPIELSAAQEMLDEEHADHPTRGDDKNIYTLGRIGEHNVVLACLPAGQTGTVSAASVAMQMKATFPSIRFGLMVGIGGGVPSAEADIRLGDVVVSQPEHGHGGVVQYDFGKIKPSGFERTGFLNTPPQLLLGAVAKLQAKHNRGRGEFTSNVRQLERITKFARDRAGPDVLFEANYNHIEGPICNKCDNKRRVQREEREDAEPVVHYGTIASGNQVMRSGRERDQVSSAFKGVLCFEMEAAGLMNSFPCLVVRGVCDYADSHKNKKWQPYAAGTAAGYAKELLLVIPAAEVAKAQTVEEAIKQHKPTFYLPFPRNTRFTGRSAELKILKQKLLVDRECNKMALVGLGGAGKTQIALRLAYTVKEEWPEFSIFWLPALSMEAFEQACGEIARKLQLVRAGLNEQEDVKRLVQQELNNETRSKWLLIVDNADSYDLICGTQKSEGIVDYLPESEHGLTVFTTRNHKVAEVVVHSDVVEVEKMDKNDALKFLQCALKNVGNESARKELLIELDYLPLAISQAAAYINTKKISITEYLRLMRNTEQDLVTIMSTELRDNTRYRGAANAVATTWIVSFEEVLQNEKKAAEILEFLSCIEWKAIPHSILPAGSSEAQLAGAVGTLCSYSFMTRREDKQIYDMHRLIHLATRIWLDHRRRIPDVRRIAIKHLVVVFPSDDYSNREIWRAYLPHVARTNKDAEDTKDKSELCLAVGRCLQVDGRIKEAVAWLEESYGQAARLVDESRYQLLVEHVLAGAYQANGQIKEAVVLLEMVVKIQEQVLAEDHPSRLASQHGLAQAYQADGQIKEAVVLLERVVKIQEQILAEDHPSQLTSQHELARAYQADGQIKEAVVLLERVVKIQEQILAEDHPSQLTSQHELARAYQANGQIKEAVVLLERVVKIREQVLAEDHPSRLTSQHGLAQAYQADGQIKEAVVLLEMVVKIQEQVLAEDHPSQLASQHGLAQAYQANGQIKEAVVLLERVVKIQEQVLAEDHPSRLTSQHGLAQAYQANGQIKEAVVLLERVVKIREQVLAEDHPSRLASQHGLAQAYQANGQIKEAVVLLERVVKIQEQVLAEDHPSRLTSQHELARAYQANGQIKEAVVLLERVVKIQKQVLAEDHPSRLTSQHGLARAYQANGQIKEAVVLLERVVKIREQVLAEDHPSRLVSQNNLAVYLWKLGSHDTALGMMAQIVEIHKRALDESHPDRQSSEAWLEYFERKMKNANEC